MQFRAVVTIYVGLVATLSAAAADVASVAESIRVEATRSNLDADGRPLPLACRLNWRISVFALVQGERPDRQWLIYAHSPNGDRSGVRITIPDHRQITVDVSLAGSFYLVDERTQRVTSVE